MGKEKIKCKVLMMIFLFEYADYLEIIKGKDFSKKLQKQLEKDKELSAEKWIKKYKPLWLKISNDREFNKYLEEKPLVECDCGSANVKCVGLGNFDKEIGIQMFKWHCCTCDKDFEVSINEKGEAYEASL